MEYSDLEVEFWDILNGSNLKYQDGYNAKILECNQSRHRNLLIFEDENRALHLIIQIDIKEIQNVIDLRINGLEVQVCEYNINSQGLATYYDVKTKMVIYKKQFTSIVKEIAEMILKNRIEPECAINTVLSNWKSFWGSENSFLLSEEKQIGLFGELLFLKRISSIQSVHSLNCWKGPSGFIHDFVFSNWSFEVKVCANTKHIHFINGLDQLDQLNDLSLGLISYLIVKSSEKQAISLQELVDAFVTNIYKNEPNLIQLFYEQLMIAGYNRSFSEEYSKNKYVIWDSRFFVVDENFPKLTKKFFKKAISTRVSHIRYLIDLTDWQSTHLDKVILGDYIS